MQEFTQDDGPHPHIQKQDTRSGQASADQTPEANEVAKADLSEDELRERVIDALKTVYDPEIPVNIYDLGLIYNVDFHGTFVHVDMTLTAPGCPVAHTFPGMVERSVELVPGISGAAVELVWDPPWTPELISEAARLELGLI